MQITILRRLRHDDWEAVIARCHDAEPQLSLGVYFRRLPGSPTPTSHPLCAVHELVGIAHLAHWAAKVMAGLSADTPEATATH
jgi:hypothetical protein